MNNQVFFEMRGISKSFPGVKALNNVGFSVAEGEVRALVGENGAGKSTLMKILNGNYKKDEVAADLTGVFEMRWLLPYFGIVADDYSLARVDGELVFAPELPQYRAFIELLRDWTAQGILTKGAFLDLHSAAAYEEAEEDAVAASGLMVSVSPYTHVPVAYMTEYEALLMPGESGETVWRDMLGSVWTGAFAVTSACSDPAAALKWVDALYGEAGVMLAYAGVEGEDYSVSEDGSWIFMVDGMRSVDEIRAEVNAWCKDKIS